jgi:hypothetical protein
MPRRKEPHIPDAILDQLLAGADPKTAFDPNGLLDGLKKALAERALNAEMDHHLAGEGGTGNGRNGYLAGSCPTGWCRSAGPREGPRVIRRPRRAA